MIRYYEPKPVNWRNRVQFTRPGDAGWMIDVASSAAILVAMASLLLTLY